MAELLPHWAEVPRRLAQDKEYAAFCSLKPQPGRPLACRAVEGGEGGMTCKTCEAVEAADLARLARAQWARGQAVDRPVRERADELGPVSTRTSLVPRSIMHD